MLMKNPGFTLVAVVTLALGIGANTAIFSVIDGVLFRALPYAEPDRLVLIWGKHAQQGEQQQQVSYLDFADIRQQRDIFDEAAAIFLQSLTLTDLGGAERFRGMLVSTNFFRLLGIEAVRGRVFSPAEDQPGNDKVVVISHRLWQNRFGGTEEIVGRKIKVNDESLTVVGVMPVGFDLEFPLSPSFRIEDNDLWLPLTGAHRRAGSRGIYTYEVIARLQKGVEPAQARELEPEAPVYLLATMDELVARSTATRRFSMLLVGGFALIALLLAAVGIYGVLSFAVSERRQEIGIRIALGARRFDILRLVVGQALALTLAGMLIGLAGSLLLTRFMTNLLYGVSPTDPRIMLLVAMALTLVALFACYIPARRATKVDPMVALRQD
jgi:putative ABC transport system permease protein